MIPGCFFVVQSFNIFDPRSGLQKPEIGDRKCASEIAEDIVFVFFLGVGEGASRLEFNISGK